MVCGECRFWYFVYKKIVGDDEYFVGECRIRSTASNSFPERFDYESCWEAQAEVKLAESKEATTLEVSKKALQFIEETKRPAARALSSEWDEYIDNIKRILQGET